MPAEALYLGVDVGGTKVHAVLTDAAGRILAELQEPTDRRGGADLADQIARLSGALSGGRGVHAACIGLPASVDPLTQGLSIIPNIANMEGAGFHDLIRDRLGPRIRLENDVNTAALAEYDDAAPPSLAFIAIGTGIGMGLVCNGALLRGAAGAAGEIALLPIGGDPESALQRGSGALEDCLGGRGWHAAYAALGGDEDTPLRELFAGDDALFARVIDRQADLLARAILAISAVAAPDAYVLGGSIGSQPRLLAALTARLPRYLARPPLVRISALGNRAGAIGAARVARNHFPEG